MNTEEVCAYLRMVRVDAGVTVSSLSKKYGWHRNTIGNYEKDRLCDLEYLYALSKEVGISLDLLLTKRLKSGPLQNLEEFCVPNFTFSHLLKPFSEEIEGIKYFTIEASQCGPIIPNNCVVGVQTEYLSIEPKQYLAIRDNKGVINACMVIQKDNVSHLLVMYPTPTTIDINSNEIEIIGKIVSILLN